MAISRRSQLFAESYSRLNALTDAHSGERELLIRLPALVRRHGIALVLDWLDAIHADAPPGKDSHTLIDALCAMAPVLVGNRSRFRDTGSMVNAIRCMDSAEYVLFANAFLERVDAAQMMCKAASQSDAKNAAQPKPTTPRRAAPRLRTGTRDALYSVRPPTRNPAWWLDHALGANAWGDADSQQPVGRSELLAAVCEWTASSEHASGTQIYRADLQADGYAVLDGAVETRLLLGAGEDSVLGLSLRLDPVWGLPVINGEGIKGLCLAVARKLENQGVITEAWRQTIFGLESQRGIVEFADALWYPTVATFGHNGGANTGPFTLDVITPHETTYHGEQGKKMPSLFDVPTPVPQLCARGSFVFGIRLGDAAKRVWPKNEDRQHCLATLIELLRIALRDRGVGAGTSYDRYGRVAIHSAP